MSADLESARHDWEDAYRRLEEASGDPAHGEQLRLQLDVVTDELRKRVGSSFTLADLVTEYPHADSWAWGAVSERAPAPGWPRTVSVVEGAAFHLYARGAVDYAP